MPLLSFEDNPPRTGKPGRPRKFSHRHFFLWRMSKAMMLEAQRQAAHELVAVSEYVRQALWERPATNDAADDPRRRPAACSRDPHDLLRPQPSVIAGYSASYLANASAG